MNNIPRTREKISVEFERFTVKGLSTCFSWAGPDERQVCQFLLSRNFGTTYVCGLNGNDLGRYDNNLIKPDKNCILWKDKK